MGHTNLIEDQVQLAEELPGAFVVACVEGSIRLLPHNVDLS
jgi:hypothetical protein